MSVADKITQLETDITNAYTAISGKGGTVPAHKNTNNLQSSIASIATKTVSTWHQCPTAVRNYLANVTYSPSDYNVSSIAQYAPAVAVLSNTKPIGNTIDGVTYYNEVPDVATPFSSANASGTVEPLDQLRWINSATSNFRDLGGWTCDGGTIKYGKLFRGAIPQAADKNLALGLGIKTELDLRGKAEAQQTSSVWDIEYVCTTNYIQYSTTGVPTWKEMLRCIFDSVAENKPVFFHCTYGADRTGTLACILEGILGVSQSDIDKDYELTSFATGTDTDAHARRRNETEWKNYISSINTFSGSTFTMKCVNFVASCGFTAQEINAFRQAMIDGSPSTVTPTITNYTVSNTLTDCTSDNNAVLIQQNQFYEAIITPDSGKVMSNISVMMGNTDVTASSAKTIIEGSTSKASGNNYVAIKTPRVTGNISITAASTTESLLPEGYTQLEYIGSTGTQTFHIPFGDDQVGYYIIYKVKRTDSGVRGLFGFGSSSPTSTTIGAGSGSYFGWDANGKYEMGGSSTTQIVSSTATFDEAKFLIYQNYSGKLYVNGVEATYRAGSSQYTHWYAFGGTNYPVSCQVQEIVLYDNHDRKTMHLIPASTNSAVGMFDIVGKTFYTNIGTGNFIAGPVVS